MRYSVVIRTLGKAGVVYQQTLDSIFSQTILPESVIVYIAEGYQIPFPIRNREEYVDVPKGMVAQRALSYEEVRSEFCLFLDDDVYLPPDAVEKMYCELVQNNAQVISPCTFENHKHGALTKIKSSLLGKEVCRLWGKKWAFKVLKTAGFSYNNNPTAPVYESQSNAGPCFFCRKDDFLKIAFQEELWLDAAPYALPEDQVMFYKMYKKGLKVLTTFDTGIVHLDANSALIPSPERMQKLIYSEYRNKLIFWHRFLYLPEKSFLNRFLALVSISYSFGLQAIKYSASYALGRKERAQAFFAGVRDAVNFLKSDEYKNIPLV